MAYKPLLEQQIGTLSHPYEDWAALKSRYYDGLETIDNIVFDSNKTDFDFLTNICTDSKYWNSDINYFAANKMLDNYGV